MGGRLMERSRSQPPAGKPLVDLGHPEGHRPVLGDGCHDGAKLGYVRKAGIDGRHKNKDSERSLYVPPSLSLGQEFDRVELPSEDDPFRPRIASAAALVRPLETATTLDEHPQDTIGSPHQVTIATVLGRFRTVKQIAANAIYGP